MGTYFNQIGTMVKHYLLVAEEATGKAILADQILSLFWTKSTNGLDKSFV
jgi:hypothetical protein